MVNMKKQIDFNHLGEDHDTNKMDFDHDDLREEITTPSPPPLKYARVPVSRISMGGRNSFEMKVSTSSSNTSSPMGRNSSLPLGSMFSPSPNQSLCRVNCSISRETPKSVNINPFTPTAILETNRKRQHSQAKRCSTPSINNVRRLESTFESLSEGEEVEQPEQPIPTPTKRVTVADFTVSNSPYEEKFPEIAEILGEDHDTNKMDLDDEDLLEEITTPSPPPLKYVRVPVSRISMGRRNSVEMKVSTSSPNTSSPMGRNSSLPLGSMSSPSPNQSLCRVTKSFPKESRRSNFRVEDSNCSISRETPKSVNINPFTPTAMLETNRKRQHSPAKRCSTPSINNVRRHESTFESLSEGEEVEQPEQPIPTPMKRVRVADFTVSNSRYEEEFLEIAEIASGEFGTVKSARHRLDGIEYAIKISKKNLEASRHDEKMALNEVFAHAALIKHKHVVRYYNSWVERGRVYIQNEFCHGGSLSQKIKEFKRSGAIFSETELTKILVQILKGLQYIHNKQLVHLDIKPDNIFISTEQDGPAPNHGASFVDRLHVSANSSSDKVNTVDYKIGDLGHVAHIYAEDISPEEGDCRYMAPEFLQMYVDPHKLSKADIFSLGLTIYEAASLTPLPKNSNDDPNYENIRKGNLPFLHNYSMRFNSLIRSMVNADPSLRPNTTQLLADSHPKCNLTQKWSDKDIPLNIHSFGHTEVEAKTVVGESLDEVDPPSEGENTKVNLIIAQDRIFDLEKEILTKNLKISKLIDTFKSVDSLNELNLSKDEKVENYEILLKKIHEEL